jgi:hypothetical protein
VVENASQGITKQQQKYLLESIDLVVLTAIQTGQQKLE